MQTIKIIPNEELDQIIPFLELLNVYTDTDTLLARLKEMKHSAYSCAGVYDDGKLIAVCGFWILIKHYVGKHIEPDNVIVLPAYRGQGIGEKIMQFIHAHGMREGCIAAELNCYVNNSAGVKFWLNQGYKILGFHLQKKFG